MYTKNNCPHCAHSNSSGTFVAGALLGAAVGSVLGLLFAPNKGEDTRKKITQFKDKTVAEGQLDLERVEGVATEILDELKVKTAPVVEDIKNFIDKVETTNYPMKEELKEKIDNLVDLVEDKVRKANKTTTIASQPKKKTFSGLK